jgi:putative PIN family toxin of toxin-antitoxin system
VRVYLDTNVLVSAYTARGLCADLMRQILAEHELVTGEVNLVELRRVLVERFGAPDPLVASVEAELREQTIAPEPSSVPPFAVRDPDDARVLASAIAAGVDLLVTGDDDLLAVAGAAPIPIVSPRGCWERLRSSAS